MRIGQTSAIVFLAKMLASAIGFLGTVYFSRELGPEIIGVYATVVALITWLQLAGKMGVTNAVAKRLSEGEHHEEYFAAGLLSISFTTSMLLTGLVVFRTYVEGYISEFSRLSEFSIVWFVIALVVFQVGYHVINSALQGQHLVHIVGLLKPVRTGLINGTQFVLVFFFGFSLLGLVVGHAVGILLTALLGTLFVSVRLRRPSRRHFSRLYEYAKYSWFGSLSNRTFSNADILILGAFVPSNLVGIYSVAWMLSSSLHLFAESISSVIFPEISSIASQEDEGATSGIIEDIIAYSGLFVIPGLVGGVLLDDRLFRVYGAGFGRGTEILGFLLFSILAYGYLSQFTTVLNGFDRPDLVFRVNGAFISANILLNVILIQLLGWTGAAIASAVSTILGAVLSYYYLSQIVSTRLPFDDLGRQVLAAVGMGATVWLLRYGIESSGILHRNILIVVSLVAVGAGIYMILLLLISRRFRLIVGRNLPFEA